MEKSIPRRRVRRFRGRPVRPRSNFAAFSAAVLKYPPPSSLVLFLAFLEALAAPAVLAGQTIRRFEVKAVLERTGVTFENATSRFFRKNKIVSDVLFETRVRYSHIFRPRYDDAQTRLIDVVLHTKISSNAMHEHSIVRGHVWKLVTSFLTILGKLDEIFLDTKQHRAILLIAIYRDCYELLEVDARTVRIEFRAAVYKSQKIMLKLESYTRI